MLVLYFVFVFIYIFLLNYKLLNFLTAPHIGHLYSAVITDCIFRYEKLRNRSTKYIMSTGTDEHGTKIQQAAAQHNQKPEQYCSTISDRYQKLFNVSNISYTHFNRTTDQEKHFPAVQHFWVSYQHIHLLLFLLLLIISSSFRMLYVQKIVFIRQIMVVGIAYQMRHFLQNIN